MEQEPEEAFTEAELIGSSSTTPNNQISGDYTRIHASRVVYLSNFADKVNEADIVEVLSFFGEIAYLRMFKEQKFALG